MQSLGVVHVTQFEFLRVQESPPISSPPPLKLTFFPRKFESLGKVPKKKQIQ